MKFVCTRTITGIKLCYIDEIIIICRVLNNFDCNQLRHFALRFIHLHSDVSGVFLLNWYIVHYYV